MNTDFRSLGLGLAEGVSPKLKIDSQVKHSEQRSRVRQALYRHSRSHCGADAKESDARSAKMIVSFQKQRHVWSQNRDAGFSLTRLSSN